jgi:hypothetical protein
MEPMERLRNLNAYGYYKLSDLFYVIDRGKYSSGNNLLTHDKFYKELKRKFNSGYLLLYLYNANGEGLESDTSAIELIDKIETQNFLSPTGPLTTFVPYTGLRDCLYKPLPVGVIEEIRKELYRIHD